MAGGIAILSFERANEVARGFFGKEQFFGLFRNNPELRSTAILRNGTLLTTLNFLRLNDRGSLNTLFVFQF